MHKHHVQKNTNDTCLGTVLRTVFLSALTLMCFYAALWMTQDIFPDWRICKRAQIWAGMLIFIINATFEAPGYLWPKYKWICRLFLPVLLGAAFYRYVKPWQIDFEDGACAFATQFLEKCNKHLRTSFAIWHGKEEWISASFSVWAIGIALILLLLALFTGWRIFLLLLPGAVLAGELLVGYTPQWKGTALFFAAVLAAFSGEGDSRWIDLPVHQRQQKHTCYRELIGGFSVVCAAATALLLAAISSGAFSHASFKLMEQAPKVKEFQRNAEDKIGRFAASFFTLREEAVSNRKPYYTGREVMKIIASKKPVSDLYLKGFCGTDYENGKWVCRDDAFAKACQQAEYEQENASRKLLQVSYNAFANGYTMEDFYSSYYEEPEQKRKKREIDYTITYTGLKNHTAYLPYLLDYSDSQDERQVRSDAAVQKSRGKKTFTAHGLNIGFHYGTAQLMPAGQQTDLSKWYDDFVRQTYLSIPKQKDSGQIVFLEDYLKTIMPSEGNSYPVIISVSLAMSENESAHTSIRKREVLELFHNLQLVLQQSDDAFEINHVRMLETLIVSAMLKQNAVYSTQLDTIPQGEDPIHYFLMKSHKGYCMHFASAAAFLLRESGVPVRYASGYVVRKKAFHKTKEGYTASVEDNGAHAWIEIYLDQIGWIPVDVTPGDYTTEIQENKQLVQNAQASNAAKPDKRPEQAEKPQPEKKEPAKKNQTSSAAKFSGTAVFKKMLVCFSVICFCIFGFAAWYGRRSYVLLPKKEMQQGQYQDAVSRMNRRLYRRLYLHGKIPQKSLTDDEFKEILASSYRQIGQDEWTRYMQAAKAAAFSNGGVCKEDAYFCAEVYERVCSKRTARRHVDFRKRG